ncbi:hypothetical protein BS333_07515 [Vibrio azureus]|uniref:Uncharacterized protein n=1 Tax=Vibrio azureus NBRC 104587 TaxID=1219077 RepID=U3ADH5_9VIBR|nr:hypothetical protein [Vibrio azureus]AUI86249.1 hypothetical protein BS333_07515 [Vibrio azureus]GAD77981.1 hypothetical protein VAZ01S_105_00090 [Vibrio azureus NBRC 104587]
MKEVLKSLKENATSRLKNPIVGAFALSWCALNINGLTVFILSSSTEKIKIASNKVWSFNGDLLIPLSIAILYLLLLPILNLAYEFINDGVINSFRDKRQNKTDKERFVRQKSTVGAKIEADEEYIRKLKDQEIENWLQEKALRNKQFIEQKSKYSSLLVLLSEKEQQFSQSRAQYVAEIESLKSKQVSISTQLDLVESDTASKLSYLEITLNELGRILDGVENANGLTTSQDIKELRGKIEEVRSKFGIWDDIPF